MNRIYIPIVISFLISGIIVISSFFSSNQNHLRRPLSDNSENNFQDTIKIVGESLEDSENSLQIIKYFRQENQIEPIPKKESTRLLEFYKVFLDKQNQNPLLEEHYLNYRKNGVKRYIYNIDNQLERIERYNVKGQKISETIYHSTGKVLLLVYLYSNNGKLKRISKFINDKPDGKWIYYNNNGQTIKEEMYKEGELQKYWTYMYDSTGNKIAESLFDKNHKQQYNYFSIDSPAVDR